MSRKAESTAFDVYHDGSGSFQGPDDDVTFLGGDVISVPHDLGVRAASTKREAKGWM